VTATGPAHLKRSQRGLNCRSSNINIKKDVVRLQAVYWSGIENYFNDAPVDIGIVNNFSNAVTPILEKALPDLGIVAFYDHRWSDKFTTAAGYSLVHIQNTEAQTPRYALTNLLYYPVKGVMMGGELQWGAPGEPLRRVYLQRLSDPVFIQV